MQLLILLSLVFDIFSDHCFAPIQTDGIGVEATRPELTSPQHLPHFRMVMEDLSGRDTFDRLHYFCQEHGRYALDKKMHMILICSYLDKVYFIALADFKAGIFEGLFGNLGEYFSSVLYWTDDVIQENRLVMALVDMVRHIPNIPLVVSDLLRRSCFTPQAARNSLD